MGDETVCLLMHIPDGHSFRHLMGIIKCEVDRAIMIVTPTGVEFSFKNTSGVAVYNIKLNATEFVTYVYNIRDEDGELVEAYPLGFDTAEMAGTTRGIGRRDGIRIYWLRGDSKLNIQPIKANNKNSGRMEALFVNIINMECCRYATSDEYDPEPNVRVQAKEFAEICTQTNGLKCNYLEITGNQNSVTFRGMLPNNTVAGVNTFRSQNETYRSGPNVANISDLDSVLRNLPTRRMAEGAGRISLNVMRDPDLMVVKVPISMIKALSKIHNVAPQGGLIRFFFLANSPIKIESQVGAFGTINICLLERRRAAPAAATPTALGTGGA